MNIIISPSDGVPIYVQIMQQIKHLVASGRLLHNDEVPPIRKMAEQLLINPNTVARAYRELEREGILISRQGSGTRVSSTGSPLSNGEKKRILIERADALLVEADQLGVPMSEVIKIIERRSRHLHPEPKEILS